MVFLASVPLVRTSENRRSQKYFQSGSQLGVCGAPALRLCAAIHAVFSLSPTKQSTKFASSPPRCRYGSVKISAISERNSLRSA